MADDTPYMGTRSLRALWGEVKTALDEKMDKGTGEAYVSQAVARIEGKAAEAEEYIDGKMESIDKKMQRYIIYLVKDGSTWRVTDTDGVTLVYDELLAHIRNIGEYVVMLYGNIKLRPQYVSTSEMQFTGVSRDSQGAYTHRVVMTATSVRYDAIELADAGELKLAENRISILESENSTLKLENKEQNYRLENLEAVNEGNTKRDVVESTENGILNLPSSGVLAPNGMVGSVKGHTRKTKNLLNPILGTRTINGVTCTKNADGTYTLSGTSTARTEFSVDANTYVPFGSLYHEGVQYKLLGCPSGGDIQGYYLYLDTASGGGTVFGQQRDYGNGVTFTFPVGNLTKTMISIRIDVAGINCDGLVFKPMLTEDLTATYDDYEPFFDGLKDAENIKVESHNPQFIHGRYTIYPNQMTMSADSTRGVSDVYEINGKKSFSYKARTSASKTLEVVVREVTDSGVVNHEVGWTSPEGVYHVVSDASTKVYFIFRHSDSSTIGENEITLVSDIIPTPNTITIPVSLKKGDVYEPSTGMMEETWGMVDLGSLDYNHFSSAGRELFITTGINGRIPSVSTKPNIICPVYNVKSYDSFASDGDISVYPLSVFQLGIYDNRYTDASAFKTAMNGVMLLYELATPVTKTFAELGLEDIDTYIPVEAGGTVRVISDGAQAEAEIGYQVKLGGNA